MDRHTIETDVLVAGGGMAGVCAAVAAARAGAKVVLLQDRSVLGGNASSEVRMHIVGADVHGSRKGWRESGLIEEFRLEDAVRNPTRSFPLWDVILYEKVAAEKNITLLLDTDLIGAAVEFEKGVDAAPPKPPRTQRLYEYRGPRGRILSVDAVRQLTQDAFTIRAKVFADCTGDGRLGFEAGADFRIGCESKAMHGESLAQDVDDIHTLGSSILFMSRRHDRPVPFIAPTWARRFDPKQLSVGRPIHSWEYGFWWIEWGGALDTIKDQCTTIRHELYAIALGLWDYVKNSGRYPDSANWTLDWIGPIPGKRESRRFLGPHVLAQQDIQECRIYADEVAYGGWPIDLHPPRGIDAIEQPPFTPTWVERPYGIPLRCYFSRNIDNLFFAGRDISATHVAFASTRVMATCAIGGQAIGMAMAQCAQTGMTPSQLVSDPQRLADLQQMLILADGTLPNVRAAATLAQRAQLAASGHAPGSPPELCIDGVTRDQLDPKTGELIGSHGWRSAPLADGPQWIELTWPAPVDIRQIHLTFDSGFGRELTLSGSDGATAKMVRGPQPETVRGYVIQLSNGAGAAIAPISVRGNYQRKRIHHLDGAAARRLRITIQATNGAPEARILEIGVC